MSKVARLLLQGIVLHGSLSYQVCHEATVPTVQNDA